MILLWGLPAEGPLAAVRGQLEQLGAPHVVLDQADVTATEVETHTGACVTGTIRSPDLSVDLIDVSAVYARPYDPGRLPAVAADGPDSTTWWHAQAVTDALWSWAETTDALVVNRPSAMASNGSKPYQSRLIERAGFLVPETLVTTDPSAVRAFQQRHGQIVYKSTSSVRSRVVRLEDADLDRLADLVWCPTQFQRYVPGTDHRVHVVADQVFAHVVSSEADDYRYAVEQGHPAPRIEVGELPAHVEERCRRLAAALGLGVAGIDLRRTPDGEFCCFEVNPSPAFTFYERATGQAVSAAVAGYLAAAEAAAT